MQHQRRVDFQVRMASKLTNWLSKELFGARDWFPMARRFGVLTCVNSILRLVTLTRYRACKSVGKRQRPIVCSKHERNIFLKKSGEVFVIRHLFPVGLQAGS